MIPPCSTFSRQPRSRRRRIIGWAIAATMLLAAAPASSAAATLNVDENHPNCSDSGSGTASQPFCTIDEGASRATAGTTVLVRAGTYVEEVGVESGAPGNPVIFEAAPGETVTVTGGDYAFYASGRSWVTIRGFRVANTGNDGFHVSSGASNIQIIGNRVISAGTPNGSDEAEGISVSDSSNVLVQDNVVEDGSSYGIYIVNSTGVNVYRNVSTNNAEVVARKASGIRVHSSNGNTISSNVTHLNEDSGIEFVSGSSNNLAVNNVSYDNGDHGIDNLEAPGQRLLSNTIFQNVTAGINAEGGSTGTLIANNISVDNAINGPRTRGNIRVDSSSILGSSMDYDIVHLRTPGIMLVWGDTLYSSLTAFRTMTSQEPNGIEADPLWRNLAARDFRLTVGSPAVDSANSGVNGHTSTDAQGNPRVDVASMPNTGVGPRAFDDRGAYEFQALPEPPNATLDVSPNSGRPPLAVTADASTSSDPDGDIESYSFNFGDGTPVVGPQGGPTAPHTYTQPGTYTVTVTVRDTGGRTSQATDQVTVSNNDPPVAALAVTPNFGRAPLDVIADASASTDPDGTIASYSFDFGDGSPVVGPQSAATAPHTYATAGTYTVKVTVRDTAGGTSETTKTVNASANMVGNPGFEASTSGWNTSGGGSGITLARVAGGHSGGWAARLNRTGSGTGTCLLNDAPNWVTTTVPGTYSASLWARADSPGATLRLRLREYAGSSLMGTATETLLLGTFWKRVSLSYTPQSPGSSTLDLSAYMTGAPAGVCFYADDVDLGLGAPPPPPGNPPVARLAVTPASGATPLDVSADASTSTDPDADIVGYRFDFGDGSPVVGPQAGATASHTYTSAGTYTVTVTVTDADGRTSQATQQVTVTGNLAGNPGFETSTSGWNTSGSGSGITLARVAGGHSGGWAARLSNTGSGSSTCLLNDAPNWVTTTGSGTYSASLWARADTPGATLRLRLREYSGSTLVGTSTETATLNTSWQRVTVAHAASAGSTLDFNAYVVGAAPGACFYADDVEIGLGEPPPPPPPGSAPTARLVVTPASGTAPLDVSADGSTSTDPDGDIASYRFDFGDGSPVVGPQSGATATHTYTAAGTYPVTITVTDGAGRTSEATQQVTVSGNLVGNPGFETSTSGWNTSGSGTLARVAGGHSGGWAARLTNPGTGSSSCVLNDSPNWIGQTSAGTYTASLWARADNPGATLKLRVREYSGSTLAATTTETATLSTAWQRVTVAHAAAAPGSTLDLNAYVSSAPPGTCFYADDVLLNVN
jgi:parallel beta-helix repeat protein